MDFEEKLSFLVAFWTHFQAHILLKNKINFLTVIICLH